MATAADGTGSVPPFAMMAVMVIGVPAAGREGVATTDPGRTMRSTLLTLLTLNDFVAELFVLSVSAIRLSGSATTRKFIVPPGSVTGNCSVCAPSDDSDPVVPYWKSVSGAE